MWSHRRKITGEESHSFFTSIDYHLLQFKSSQLTESFRRWGAAPWQTGRHVFLYTALQTTTTTMIHLLEQFLSSFMVICHVCHKDNQWSQLYRRAACKNILACLSGYEWWIHETLKNFHRRETSIFPYTKKKMKKNLFFFILSMLSHLSRFTAAVEHKSVDNEQSIEHGTQLWSYLT